MVWLSASPLGSPGHRMARFKARIGWVGHVKDRLGQAQGWVWQWPRTARPGSVRLRPGKDRPDRGGRGKDRLGTARGPASNWSGWALAFIVRVGQNRVMSDTKDTQSDSNLVRHAEYEMRLAGLYDEDADYGGLITEAVMALVREFASQGHSGGSAAITLAVLEKVLRFQPLTPLTSDPGEWDDVSEMVGHSLWQNRRDPSAFSEDGGQTWYHVEG